MKQRSNAENNYMRGRRSNQTHKAHIMVAVLGEEEKLLERGKLFTKAMAVCCKQKYATGVYPAAWYLSLVSMRALPICSKRTNCPSSTGFGSAFRSRGGLNGYIRMDVFGKEEMEVLNTDAEPEELRDFWQAPCLLCAACM